ncbi:hypothetical protein BH09ACT11_BH09ACT11_11390 [soil metagenome]
MPILTRIFHHLGAATTVAFAAALVAGIAASAAYAGRGETDQRVPVALVNNDEIITSGHGKEAQTIAAGRLLAADLSEPEPEAASLLDFTLTDRSRAEDGLQSGDYYAVVTIPAGFSKAVSQLGTDTPTTARIHLETNDANSRLVGVVSEQVTAAAVASFGDDLTTQYLDNTYRALDDLAGGLSEIATGASDVADGAASLSENAQDLTTGADSVAAGTAEVADSLRQLQGGAREVSSAAGALSSGAEELQRGAAQVSDGARRVAGATAQSAAGAGDLADALSELSEGADEVHLGAAELAQGATETAQGVATLHSSAAGAAAGSAELAQTLAQLYASCPASAGPYCAQVAATVPAATAAAQQSALVSRGLGAAQTASAEVSDGAEQVANSTGALAAGVDSSGAAAAALADGTAQTADAAAKVSSGADRLLINTKQLASGASEVAAASSDLATGATSLTKGAEQAADGAAEVAAGADSLSDGAASLADSTETLATSLDETAAEVPTYSKDQRAQLSRVVATPVDVRSQDLNPLQDRSSPTVPLAVLIALLCLTATAFAIRSPLPPWALRGGGTTRRIILAGLRPGLYATGLLCAATLALSPVGIAIAHPGLLAMLTGTAGLTLLTLHQAMSALASRRAPAIATGFLLLQLAAVPWVLPLDTAPAWIQTLNQTLPIPAFLNGLNAVVLGGDQSTVPATMLVLIGWAIAGLVLTTVAIERGHRRLHAPTSVGTARPASAPAL